MAARFYGTRQKKKICCILFHGFFPEIQKLQSCSYWGSRGSQGQATEMDMKVF